VNFILEVDWELSVISCRIWWRDAGDFTFYYS